MPSLIDIRRRIRAVKSTQQITKAMKMVASSKLRRAQERVVGARPFAEEAERVLASLASRVEPSAHPLLATGQEPPHTPCTLAIVVTADKGLCGSFNTNVIKATGALLEREQGLERGVALALVGRRGRDFFKRRAVEVRYERVNLFARLEYSDAREIAKVAIEEFTSSRVDTVRLVFNEFRSILQQRVVTTPLLPIPRPPADASRAAASGVDYLYEPAPVSIFPGLLPRYIEIQIYRALLESAAAEQAARMTAMDAATRNSAEMIEHLTLYMNKVRQAAITREIIEVVSGAEAL